MTMMTTVLRVAAPRLLTVKNHKALLHHVLDCVDDGARDVVVDLSNTTYMDSSGLSALIGLHRVLSSDLRGRLRVTGVNPDLRLLLQATRLDRTIEVGRLGRRAADHGRSVARARRLDRPGVASAVRPRGRSR